VKKEWKKSTLLAGLMLVLGVLLAACGDQGNGNGGASETKAPTESASAEQPAAEQGTKSYTDCKGRTVEIPVAPERLVYVGSDPGDLFALGVTPLGASLSVIGTQVVYPDLLEGIEDISYPANLEKVTALDPDLILFADWDETAIEALEKIAPTVVIGSEGTFGRLDQYADILGKGDEAAAYKAEYEAKAEEMKKKLKDALPNGETATVLLQLGKELYVMGYQGLPVSMYDMLGYKPTESVQELIDKDERFAVISSEVIADYAGDVLFVLTDETEETTAATDKLLSSPIWGTIDAVKNKQVYVMSSSWNYDDPITRDRLLDELVKVMTAK
jgi:iron complex transport system substrate-binding protein